MFATPDVLEAESIGVGDELIVVGLFSGRSRGERNSPIVRSGTIASMEPLPFTDETTGAPYTAYLAELRSTAGLSGSPVFVRRRPGRIEAGGVKLDERYWLVGLIRGHWEIDRAFVSDYETSESERLNTGIAVVSPIRDVAAVLESAELTALRRRNEARHRSEDQATG
jgi:hypothetical protein